MLLGAQPAVHLPRLKGLLKHRLHRRLVYPRLQIHRRAWGHVGRCLRTWVGKGGLEAAGLVRLVVLLADGTVGWGGGGGGYVWRRDVQGLWRRRRKQRGGGRVGGRRTRRACRQVRLLLAVLYHLSNLRVRVPALP